LAQDWCSRRSHFLLFRQKNWWSRAGTPDQIPVGEIGGPTSEVFYEFPEVDHDSSFGKECHPNCDCGRFIEIGNCVFMEYEKIAGGLQKLPAQNVDFAGGLERIAAAVQCVPDVFKIDIFTPILRSIEVSSGKKYEGEYMPAMRVIADHLTRRYFYDERGFGADPFIKTDDKPCDFHAWGYAKEQCKAVIDSKTSKITKE